MDFDYKKKVSLDGRQNDSKKVMETHKNRIPIICERCPESTAPVIQKKKFLVPPEMRVGQFGEIIRRKMELSKETALFFLVNGTHSLSGNQLMSEVYDKFKDPEDSFLYIGYSNEMVWG